MTMPWSDACPLTGQPCASFDCDPLIDQCAERDRPHIAQWGETWGPVCAAAGLVVVIGLAIMIWG